MSAGKYVFFIVVGLLLLLVALFPVLTADTITYLLDRRALMEPGNFALIFFLEVSRAFTSVVALLAIVVLLTRRVHVPDGRALLLFVLFSVLTYQKIVGATGLPGPLQERLTMWLLDRGVGKPFLAWLFGPLPWTVWPAFAAVIRFSAIFPQPLSAQQIDQSGMHDRKGMMRGAGVAGADIGAVFRALSKRLLAAGAFRPVPLWMAALTLVVLTSLLEGPARLMLLAIVGAVATGIAITNFRAAFGLVAPEERARMRWPVAGMFGAAGLLLLATVPLVVVDIPAATVPALVILMLATAIIAVCMAAAVLWYSRLPAQTRGVLV